MLILAILLGVLCSFNSCICCIMLHVRCNGLEFLQPGSGRWRMVLSDEDCPFTAASNDWLMGVMTLHGWLELRPPKHTGDYTGLV